MNVTVFPSKSAGTLAAVPSKSFSHRALICALLSGGQMPTRLADSKDIGATKRAMAALLNENPAFADCGESGSTLRFLIPLAAALSKDTVFTGQGRLMSRPQGCYETLFSNQGIAFENRGGKIFVGGGLKSGKYEVEGNVSSQFITGLLLALPLLDGDSSICVKPPFESRSYVDITIEVMREYGVNAEFVSENEIAVRGGQRYKETAYQIEGDYSQAAFFLVLGTLCGGADITGLKENTSQGDSAIIGIIKNFGGRICRENDCVSASKASLDGGIIDIADCPDLGPILTVMAAFCNKKVTITNAARLRFKESDRIGAMESELKKLSVNISSDENNIYINGREKMKNAVAVNAHNDHRIAMSLAVFAAAGENAVTINGAECVEKSYPDFFSDLAKLSVKIEVSK